jgi:hypothetical protein
VIAALLGAALFFSLNHVFNRAAQQARPSAARLLPTAAQPLRNCPLPYSPPALPAPAPATACPAGPCLCVAQEAGRHGVADQGNSGADWQVDRPRCRGGLEWAHLPQRAQLGRGVHPG